MKQIIVINGTGGCGKDAFVDLCMDIGGKDKVLNVSTIEPIKEMAKIAGWDGEKTPEVRKFLSDLKDLCEETFNTSYLYIERRIKEFNESDMEIMFIHSREPEQIKRFCKEFNAKSLLIIREDHPLITSNHADACVYDYTYDYTVKNPGDTLKNYREVAKEFLTKLINNA